MENIGTVKPTVVIRLKTVRRYFGIDDAARVLDVSGTQVKRHISGKLPSRSLARRMIERGVVLVIEN